MDFLRRLGGAGSSHHAKDSALKGILDSNVEEIEGVNDPTEAEDEQKMEEEARVKGLCVECRDHTASIHCEQCADDYCGVCFGALHKRGTRKRHAAKQLVQTPQAEAAPAAGASSSSQAMVEDDTETETSQPSTPAQAVSYSGDRMLERAKYIPLRLTLDERKKLRLLEAALNVSEYTDRVDILSYVDKGKRIIQQLKEICAIMSGLAVASDYKAGQALVKDREFHENEEFFQDLFELGRRYKILNPEKMRGTYGKLIYLLQDSSIPEIQEMLGFSCVRPLRTVYTRLEEAGALDMLREEYVEIATAEVVASPGKSRAQIQKEIKTKERAQDYLGRKYARPGLTEDQIKQCIYSISDNNGFLRTNRDPCDRMIQYLTKYFDANSHEHDFSLAISMGSEGARLSHNHKRQFSYVFQSLTLWRDLLNDFFKLWVLAEADLLDSGNYYRLRDTGQGLNRVQHAPKISRAAHHILYAAQQKFPDWVGSSVIHLGDHNVPNALMFIDKYTQVSRILNPIVICLDQIDQLCENRALRGYIQDNFGDEERLKKVILCDFFRHAFDGSGADNFFDAGSCIDGRLTSAWNWCSKLDKKSYHHVFLLTGFIGFDGNFQT